jgi:hypothetical protein
METLSNDDLDGINEDGGIVGENVRARSSVVGVKGMVGRGSSANHVRIWPTYGQITKMANRRAGNKRPTDGQRTKMTRSFKR